MRHFTASLLTAALAAGAAAQFGKEGATCGGIAAMQCAAGFKCENKQRDKCDPANGGADCAGTCTKDDGSSQGGDGGGGGGGGSGAGQSCGGISAKGCPDGFECVDDPSDTCDPMKGGADCPSICKAKGSGGGGGGGSAPASYTMTTAPGPISMTNAPYPTGGNSTTTAAATTTATNGGPQTSTSVVLSTAQSSGSASASAGASQGAAPAVVVDSLAWAAMGLGLFAGL